jgi:5-methylcytosine-specific restriction endonuclease McrA
MSRDWDDPQYKEWRRLVRKRDGHKCQMPGCSSKKALKVHHIMTWAKFPGLRFDIRNGITLCRKCHDSIAKKEQYYAQMFFKILRDKK